MSTDDISLCDHRVNPIFYIYLYLSIYLYTFTYIYDIYTPSVCSHISTDDISLCIYLSISSYLSLYVNIHTYRRFIIHRAQEHTRRGLRLTPICIAPSVCSHISTDDISLCDHRVHPFLCIYLYLSISIYLYLSIYLSVYTFTYTYMHTFCLLAHVYRRHLSL